MKSSRPATLKGQANQIIKQIVKVVLPSDVVQLQPGRKPKRRVKGAKKRKRSEQPKGGLPPPPPPPPPMYPSVFGANVPRAFIQPTFQPVFQQPSLDKMLYEKLLKEKEKAAQPLATPMTPVTAVPPISIPSRVATPTVAASSANTPMVGSVSLSDLQKKSQTIIAETGSFLELVRERQRSRSRAPGVIQAEEVPQPPKPSPLLQVIPPSPPPLQPAPNRANQPSVDVDGDGKEAQELQPQQPAETLFRAAQMPSPYQVSSSLALDQKGSSSSAASAAVFGGEGKYADEEDFPIFTEESRYPVPNPPGSPRQTRLRQIEVELKRLEGARKSMRKSDYDRMTSSLLSEKTTLEGAMGMIRTYEPISPAYTGVFSPPPQPPPPQEPPSVETKPKRATRKIKVADSD